MGKCTPLLAYQSPVALTQMHEKEEVQEAEKDERMRRRVERRSGGRHDVYLCSVYWIMDDSCLRFLQEEERGV